MKKCTILLALIATLGACKKDDNGSSSSTAGATTLKTGNWKLSASTAVVEYPAPIGTQTVDIYDLLDACETDNTFKFNANNSVTIDEGATKCDASDPQTETGGSWTLTNNDTKFSLVYQGTTIAGDVMTLNNSTFSIKYVTTANGITSTTTSTYSRP